MGYAFYDLIGLSEDLCVCILISLELAVYHDDIRDELIAACAQEGRYCKSLSP